MTLEATLKKNLFLYIYLLIFASNCTEYELKAVFISIRNDDNFKEVSHNLTL